MRRSWWRALTALILACTVVTPVRQSGARAGPAQPHEASVVAAHPDDQPDPNPSAGVERDPRPASWAAEEAAARRALAAAGTPALRDLSLQATGVYTPHLVSNHPSSPLVPWDGVQPRDPEGAAAQIKASLRRLAQPAASTATAAYTPPIAGEIEALADGLNNDPKLIYQYVHNHYDYVPTWGLSQAPHDTTLSKMGNAFDLSTLLLALLQAAGYQAEYALGHVEIPLDQVRNWVGIQDQQALDDAMFWYGAIPGQIDGSVVQMDHVWVRVRVGSTWHPLDPSFKTYAATPGIDLAQALAYDRATFLTAAEQGAQITSDAIKDINGANISDHLTQYATNLMDYLRQEAPFAYVDEIIGGREIVPISVENLPSQLPYTMVESLGQSTSMPDEHVNKWHFELPGIDFTAYFPDILGQRVTLFYYGATQADRDRIASDGGIFNVYPAYEVDMKPHLAIGDQIVAVGDAAPLGTAQPVAFSIVSAALDPEGDPYTFPYQSEDGTLTVGEWYAFPLSAACVSPEVLERQNRVLQEHVAAGEDGESEAVLGQSLRVTGLSWMNQAQAGMLLDNRIAGTVPIPHWQAIIMSQDVQQEWAQVGGQPKVVRVRRASQTIHAPMWNLAFVSASGDSAMAPAVQTHTLLRASAAEGAIWQQLQDASAVSTVSLLDLANAQRSRIYHLTSSNVEAVVPLLQFPESFKQTLRGYVGVGWEIFVPEEPLSVDEWYGVGWARYYPGTGGLSSSITGGIGWSSAQDVAPADWSQTCAGGSPSTTAPLQPDALNTKVGSGPTQAPKPPDNNNPNSPKAAGPDVVDTASGAFLYQAQDIAFGVLGHPIHFERFYVSDDHLADGPLGYGWTHSCHLRLVESSDWMRGSGLRSAMDAAGPIAESYVSLDLLSTDAQLHQRMVIGCAAAKWALDGVTDNVATVTDTDGRPQQHVELPDGTYRPSGSLFWSLTAHSDGTYTLDGKDGSRIRFDAQGRGTSLKDANGNQTSLTYDGEGHLTRVTDAVGRSIELSYSDGHLIEVTDPLGRALRYEYDVDGNLNHYTDARGGTTSYAYDADHRVTAVTDPEGLTVVANVYDELGRVLQQTDGRGGTTTFRYAGVHTTVTDPMGYDTVYWFDAYDRLVEIEDPLGTTTSSSYDAGDNVIAATDGNGGTATFAYDARGNLTRLTDTLGHAALLEYDAQDNLTCMTDALGRTTHVAYDANKNPTTITDALGQLTTLSHDAKGQLYAVTDANGHTSNNGYDDEGNLTSVTDPLGHTTSLRYDAAGRVISITDPEGATTRLVYDAGDNVISTTDPLGHETSHTYDANELLTSLADARGNVTQYGYDPQFNLTSVTDPLGHVTRYAYDANNRLIRITDAKGHDTYYERDAVGQLTAITDPLGRTTRFTHDGNGNVLTRTKADGNTIHYEYDGENRLTKIAYPDGSAVSQAYDAVGNLISSSYGDWQAQYQYDDMDRRIRQDLPGDKLSVVYAYDPVANPLKLEVRRDGTLLYQVQRDYDAADRLTRTVDEISNQTISYSYDSIDRITSIAYASGAQTIYAYDASSRTTEVTNLDGDSGTMSAWAYAYDEVGNPVEVTRTTPATSLTMSYGYDALDRLIRESYPRHSVEYQYDPVGNRTRMASPLGVVDYVYDAADQLLSAGGATFSYDANGNRISRSDARGMTVYGYDDEGRLVQISAPGGTEARFAYDSYGRRTAASEPEGERRFVHDGLKLMVEWEPGSERGRTYVYGNGLLVGGRPFGPDENLAAIGYHGDSLGSVVNLSDAAGMARSAYAYDAFGRGTSPACTRPQSYQFLGQLGVRAEDVVGDLYLMGLRYYDAAVGRFITPDPVLGSPEVPGTFNRYVYAFGNPLRYVDPHGLRPKPPVRTWSGSCPDWRKLTQQVADLQKWSQPSYQSYYPHRRPEHVPRLPLRDVRQGVYDDWTGQEYASTAGGRS